MPLAHNPETVVVFFPEKTIDLRVATRTLYEKFGKGYWNNPSFEQKAWLMHIIGEDYPLYVDANDDFPFNLPSTFQIERVRMPDPVLFPCVSNLLGQEKMGKELKGQYIEDAPFVDYRNRKVHGTESALSNLRRVFSFESIVGFTMKATGRDVIAGDPPKFPFLCRFFGSVIRKHPSFDAFVKQPGCVGELNETDVSFIRMLAMFGILFLRQGSLSMKEFEFLQQLTFDDLPAFGDAAPVWHEFAMKQWTILRCEWVQHVCGANEPELGQPQTMEANNQEEQPNNDSQ